MGTLRPRSLSGPESSSGPWTPFLSKCRFCVLQRPTSISGYEEGVVVIVHHPHHCHMSRVPDRVDFLDQVHSNKQVCSRHTSASKCESSKLFKEWLRRQKPSRLTIGDLQIRQEYRNWGRLFLETRGTIQTSEWCVFFRSNKFVKRSRDPDDSERKVQQKKTLQLFNYEDDVL
jgi:hypothetical protein